MNKNFGKKMDLYLFNPFDHENYNNEIMNKLYDLNCYNNPDICELERIFNNNYSVSTIKKFIKNNTFCIKNLIFNNALYEQVYYLSNNSNLLPLIKFHHTEKCIFIIKYKPVMINYKNQQLKINFSNINEENDNYVERNPDKFLVYWDYTEYFEDFRSILTEKSKYKNTHFVDVDNDVIINMEFPCMIFCSDKYYRLFKLILDLYDLPKHTLTIQNDKPNDYGFYFNLMDYIENKLYDNGLSDKVNNKLTRHYKCVVKQKYGNRKLQYIMKFKNLIKLIYILINNMIPIELIYIIFNYM